MSLSTNTDCSVSYGRRICRILEGRFSGSQMFQCFGNSDSLEAMKRSLRDLDQIMLVSSDDLALLDLKRALQSKITELERQEPSAVRIVQPVAAD